MAADQPACSSYYFSPKTSTTCPPPSLAFGLPFPRFAQVQNVYNLFAVDSRRHTHTHTQPVLFHFNPPRIFTRIAAKFSVFSRTTGLHPHQLHSPEGVQLPSRLPRFPQGGLLKLDSKHHARTASWWSARNCATDSWSVPTSELPPSLRQAERD